MKISRKFRVCGKVQGVFFRASAKQQADCLGLTGWIRNCENGDVEGLVSGEAEAVSAMMNWLAEGPRMARVDKLTVSDCDLQSFTNFVVGETSSA
ncbi:MAG: acylphosphatase [Gammaproteobacteria bacterium]|nr:acylphosphatase [Gammaproteobacteria bacterium]